MLLGRDILKPTAVLTATQAHHMSRRVSEGGLGSEIELFPLEG